MNFREVYNYVTSKLNSVGIFNKSETDFLICEALGIKRIKLKLLKTISSAEYNAITKILLERVKHKPLDKILQCANFFGYNFLVNEDVLSPRPETEILVEEVIKYIKSKGQNLKVLDLCTGSGCIAIIIALKTNADVVATDISAKALKIAKTNADSLGAEVQFIESDLFKKLENAKFDIIVSNPPYIPSADIKTLDPEVKNYDPIIALDGGINGLEFYKKIIAEAKNYLNKNSLLCFEVGFGQAKKVKTLMEKDYTVVVIKDYSQIERVVYGIRR
ncbi:MAG: peptide chain release factor N(5)-glutamine methyltransferase [Clostridia bacterium]|jgi:release factor glutamine methyltransferase|nr:peptide chain release factor N(5)-glutamine methyltransferase [Clostridia bacterium]MDD4275717.1 peptide chain release factor N(5)-glutamine methyltransferase [Clostridia bacterium]